MVLVIRGYSRGTENKAFFALPETYGEAARMATLIYNSDNTRIHSEVLHGIDYLFGDQKFSRGVTVMKFLLEEQSRIQVDERDETKSKVEAMLAGVVKPIDFNAGQIPETAIIEYADEHIIDRW